MFFQRPASLLGRYCTCFFSYCLQLLDTQGDILRPSTSFNSANMLTTIISPNEGRKVGYKFCKWVLLFPLNQSTKQLKIMLLFNYTAVTQCVLLLKMMSFHKIQILKVQIEHLGSMLSISRNPSKSILILNYKNLVCSQ